jgi:hypothetical protein
MVAETTGSYDALGWTVLGEVRMGVTETHLFDVLNRVKPMKRCLTRLFTVNSPSLTMVNDKIDKYTEFESVFKSEFQYLHTTHHLLSNGFGKLNGLSVVLLNKKNGYKDKETHLRISHTSSLLLPRRL